MGQQVSRTCGSTEDVEARIRKELSERDQRLQTQEKALQSAKQDTDRVRVESQQERDHLLQTVAELEAQLAQERDRNSALENEAVVRSEESARRNDELDKRLDELEELHKRDQLEIETMRVTTQSTEAELIDVQRKLSQELTKTEDLEAQVGHWMATAQEREHDYEELQQQMTKQKPAQVHISATHELEVKLAFEKKTNEELVQKYEHDVDEMRNQMQDMDDEIQRLRAELDTAQLRAEAAQEKLQTLEAKILLDHAKSQTDQGNRAPPSLSFVVVPPPSGTNSAEPSVSIADKDDEVPPVPVRTSSGASDVWERERVASLKFCEDQARDIMDMINKGQIDPNNAQQVQEFTAKLHQDYTLKHRQLFLDIWTKYDLNKDGLLSREECRGLVRDSLQASRRVMPSQIIDAIVSMLLIASPEELDAEARDSIKQRVSGLPISQIIEEQAIKLIEKSEELSDQLWERLDKDKDGRVTREDFLEGYAEASNEILTANKEIVNAILQGVNS